MNPIRQNLKNKAKIIQFPKGIEYLWYKNVENIVRLPLIKDSTYKNWKLNEHHFKPFYHFNHVLPILNSIFKFGFNIEDFKLVENKYNQFDISYLYSKKDYKFDIISYTEEKRFDNVDYSFIRFSNCNEFTSYHRLYKYPHECSRVINNSINSNRILFISGDSQLIPDIPVLSCYFKEVWYFDNRTFEHYIQNLKDINVTDVLFSIGYNEKIKYWGYNLL